MSRAVCVFLILAAQACAGTRTLAPARPTTKATGPGEDNRIVTPIQDGIDPDPGAGAPLGEPPPATVQAPHPFDDLTDDQLEDMLVSDPDSLGALSVGRTNAGALIGGVQMPGGEQWAIVNTRETWGTPETIEVLAHCINRVSEQFPDTPAIPIGDISTKDGGHLAPHLSHQSGRDVDLGYYYTTSDAWYARATGDNLDLPRTWAFVKAVVTETDVELIFIDRSVQKLLRDYAVNKGEDGVWLDDVFGGPSASYRPIIRHEPGHDTHVHVRFYNPIAQESGRRMHRLLVAHKKVKPPTYHVNHKVGRGDTLIRIARKYKTTVKAIMKANRLRSNRIYAGKVYKIPRRGGVPPPASAIVIPARRLPPEDTLMRANRATDIRR